MQFVPQKQPTSLPSFKKSSINSCLMCQEAIFIGAPLKYRGQNSTIIPYYPNSVNNQIAEAIQQADTIGNQFMIINGKHADVAFPLKKESVKNEIRETCECPHFINVLTKAQPHNIIGWICVIFISNQKKMEKTSEKIYMQCKCSTLREFCILDQSISTTSQNYKARVYALNNKKKGSEKQTRLLKNIDEMTDKTSKRDEFTYIYTHAFQYSDSVIENIQSCQDQEPSEDCQSWMISLNMRMPASAFFGQNFQLFDFLNLFLDKFGYEAKCGTKGTCIDFSFQCLKHAAWASEEIYQETRSIKLFPRN